MSRLVFAGVLATAVVACGRTSLPRAPAAPTAPLQVTPIAAGMSDMWNIYARYSGGPLLAIDGSACDPAPTYHDCIHAGELRRLDVTDVTSCAGVTAQDSLSAFAWSCAETASGISLVSSGLAPGFGLRDLIDFSAVAFRPIHLSVSTPAGPRITTDAVWWSNPVVTAPADNGDAGASLNADATIYVVPQSRATAGLNLSGHGAALVTAPGARLSAASGQAQCSLLVLGVNTRQPAQCVVWANNSERLWLELDALGDTADSAVLLGIESVVLPRLHDVHVHLGAGLQALDVQGGRITNFIADLPNALVFQGTRDTLVRDVRIAGGEAYLFDSHDNVFENLTVSGTFAGIDAQGSTSNNVFVRPLSFAHSANAVQLVGTGNVGNVFVGYTFADTGGSVAGIFGAQRHTFALGIMANSGQHGIDSVDVSLTFTNLVTAMNGFAGIELDTGSGYERFNGQLRLGQNALGTCDIASSVQQPGITPSSCAAADMSVLDAVQLDLPPFSASFYGDVSQDDAVNTSDSAGGASFPADAAAFDYSGVENRYRGWIAGTNLAASARGCPAACFSQAAAPLQLVDWRLRANDALLRNTSLSAAGNPPFVDGAACPAGLDGDTVARDTHDGEVAGDGIGNDDGLCEDGEACAGNTYVIAAIEIIDDYTGDDDGLCESGEACIYAPNFGAYQGEGDYRSHTCAFADGIVTGVSMYAYPTNGAAVP